MIGIFVRIVLNSNYFSRKFSRPYQKLAKKFQRFLNKKSSTTELFLFRKIREMKNPHLEVSKLRKHYFSEIWQILENLNRF